MYNLASYVAVRRLIPTSRTPGATLLPRLAFFSIVLGVVASILILSLANGLNDNYLRRLAEKDAHLNLIAPGKGVPAYEEVISQIKIVPGVLDAFPYSQNEALIKSYFETRGILLKSFPKNFNNDSVFQDVFKLQSGEWSFNTKRQITIGKALADSMGLFVNDYVEILTYDKDFGAVTYRMKISGVFTVGDTLLDSSITFISFDDAAEIFNFQGYAPSVGVRVENYTHPEKYLKALNDQVPFRFSTWKLNNMNAILALENEKQIIHVLLIIFFCVAFFGILSVMTALVADKREEIALLKVLGMTPKENTISFVLTGLYLGLSASGIGLVLGILLSLNFNSILHVIEKIITFFRQTPAKLFGLPVPSEFTFLNQNVYYLKEFPIVIKIEDLIFSVLAAVFCVLLAAIYPARLAEKFSPAEILRKE